MIDGTFPASISGQINKSECGYFKGRTCSSFLTSYELLKTSAASAESAENSIDVSGFYYTLLNNGFRRYSDFYYINNCEACSECTPIRIHVKDFKPSKSQRAVWRKNQDIEVSLHKQVSAEACSADFFSAEKCALFRDYDYYHNGGEQGYSKMTLDEAARNLSQMVSGYSDVWNMEYRLDGKLIGVGVLDFAEGASKKKALSSNYFYYDTSAETLKRSIGVFSVLKEIELCQLEGIEYYYLGLYLPGCRKMSYKANYKPYELLLDGRWSVICTYTKQRK